MYKIILFHQIKEYTNDVPDNMELVLHVAEPTDFTKIIINNNEINIKKFIYEKKIKYILGHNDNLIKIFELDDVNFKKILFHNVLWTDMLLNFNISNKIFKTSYMTTGKNYLKGHKMRVDLWNNYINKLNNIDIYKSSHYNSGLKEYDFEIKMNKLSKDVFLKNYMFSIIIENDIEYNWFTEKILDCIMQYTIPIYIGCPNIGDYFNINGMIICNNIDEVIEKVNNLSPDDYFKRQHYVKENFNKGLELINLTRESEYDKLFGKNNWIFKYYT